MGVFEDLGLVGKGTYGEVYRATVIGSGGKMVAIKTMSLGEDDESILNEMKLLSDLDHPNIVKYYSSFEHQGSIWVVMEYCLINLSSFLRKMKRNF